MAEPQSLPDRRSFLKAASAVSGGITGLGLLPLSASATDADANIIGPKTGYSPQIGTLYSMLTWMPSAITDVSKGLSKRDLDYLFDRIANTLGALLLISRRQRPILQ
jgi:hypothetical protein